MDSVPEVSVIIPTYNRRTQLLRCLSALSRQSAHAGSLEVVVVDDGSTDGTSAAAAEGARSLGLRSRCVSQANAGANAARNRGIELATAPLLLIINDDTIATEYLVAEHLRLHRAHPEETVAVLGRMVISPDLPFSHFHALHHEASFAPLAGQGQLHWSAFLTSNLSVKRSILGRGNRFNERLRWHEDIELGERLARQGLRLLYNPDALAYHDHLLTETSYLGIADKEGRALAQWYSARPDLLPDLVALGFHSSSLGARSLRHAIADLAITPVTFAVWRQVGRLLASWSPVLAQTVYRKLFQWRKRRAIEAELAGIAGGSQGLPDHGAARRQTPAG